MKLNEKQFRLAVSLISNDVIQKILFLLYKDNTYTYNDIRKIISEYKKWNDSSGKFAYYIRKLNDRKIIKKDLGYYYLTRFGLQITKLAYDLQQVCMEYDLNDCDADGKIMVMVKRS